MHTTAQYQACSSMHSVRIHLVREKGRADFEDRNNNRYIMSAHYNVSTGGITQINNLLSNQVSKLLVQAEHKGHTFISRCVVFTMDNELHSLADKTVHQFRSTKSSTRCQNSPSTQAQAMTVKPHHQHMTDLLGRFARSSSKVIADSTTIADVAM